LIELKYARPRKYVKISRYKIYRQIIDNDNNIYIETVNQTPVDESKLDKYHEVLKEEENRLDIISNKYYNTPEYYWVIALANDMIDPFVVKVGDILRIPNFFSLTNWKGALYGRV
jgi:hypothetical protein